MRMGDDIGLGCVPFDFHHGAALQYWACRLRSESEIRQQSEPKPMSSPINYPA